MVPEKQQKKHEQQIPTVGGALLRLCGGGSGPQRRVHILQGLSGRIRRGKLTLVMGPPGE